ncbi:hypothetical protein ACJ73_04119 [Blastomyces percursus]|uniref:Uncharacterized protein n=1 Tax=Blastomyces percursus TaxID=1658174 RepID=A0A1J9QWC5_9EURO|nr:hypothetical protein ACJ73_04119 [Blastomyces percursus]
MEKCRVAQDCALMLAKQHEQLKIIKPDTVYFDIHPAPATTPTRAPGDVKPSWKWRIDMGGSQIHNSRYGFLVINQELVAIRKLDGNGNLELAQPNPLDRRRNCHPTAIDCYACFVVHCRPPIQSLVNQSQFGRRTTSSHLHVVSAGNSQRNSMAVSECQEELNNTIIHHQRRVEAAKNNPGTSRNTKHTAQYRKEVVPPFTYASGWKADLVPPFSRPTTAYGI